MGTNVCWAPLGIVLTLGPSCVQATRKPLPAPPGPLKGGREGKQAQGHRLGSALTRHRHSICLTEAQRSSQSQKPGQHSPRGAHGPGPPSLHLLSGLLLCAGGQHCVLNSSSLLAGGESLLASSAYGGGRDLCGVHTVIKRTAARPPNDDCCQACRLSGWRSGTC